MTSNIPPLTAIDILDNLRIKDENFSYDIYLYENWYLLNKKATYCFIEKPSEVKDKYFKNNHTKNFMAFTKAQSIALKHVMNEISSYTNFKFQEVRGKHKLKKSRIHLWNRIPMEKRYEHARGFTAYPIDYNLNSSTNIWILFKQNDHTINIKKKNFPINDAMVHSMRHEVLHALGFGHPYNHRACTQRYTVMSYHGFTFKKRIFFSASLRTFDILTIQAFYGQNKNTNSKNNYYKWNLTKQNLWQTLWDANGQDTFDLSITKMRQVFDMRDSQFSDIGKRNEKKPRYRNFSIAYTTIIENYTGSDKGNCIFGNQANNVINGGNDDDIFCLSDRYIVTKINSEAKLLTDKIQQTIKTDGWGHDVFYSSGGQNYFILDVKNPERITFHKKGKSLIVKYTSSSVTTKSSSFSSLTVTHFNPKKHFFLFRIFNKKMAKKIREKSVTAIRKAQKVIDKKHMMQQIDLCEDKMFYFDEKVAAITHQPMVKTKEWIALAF